MIQNPFRMMVSGNKVMAVLWPLGCAVLYRIRLRLSHSMGISHRRRLT
jgi:hypothetical protein